MEVHVEEVEYVDQDSHENANWVIRWPDLLEGVPEVDPKLDAEIEAMIAASLS